MPAATARTGRPKPQIARPGLLGVLAGSGTGRAGPGPAGPPRLGMGLRLGLGLGLEPGVEGWVEGWPGGSFLSEPLCFALWFGAAELE